MDIQLKSLKNIKSTNVDNIYKIQVLTKTSLLTEYDVKSVISATDVFNEERESNEVYRIHGRIEYVSMLNGLMNNYHEVENFFQPQSNDRNLKNSFSFYLVRPITLTNIPDINGGETNKYVRYFEVIATPNNFELQDAGFSNNVYGEQLYCFSFNEDIDVSQYFDSLGFPVTELFLYTKPIRYYNLHDEPEKLSGYTWNSTNTPTKSVVNEYYYGLNVGNIIYGDIIEYDKKNFLQTQVSGQTYFLATTVSDENGVPADLQWKFNPFIPLRLRYFSSDLQYGNTDSTSYDVLQSIPNYATQLDGNNYVWRNILPQGYYDPITDLGVDHPFVNKKRYSFYPITFDVIPALSDMITLDTFTKIKYNDPDVLNENPKSNLNEIGKPC